MIRSRSFSTWEAVTVPLTQMFGRHVMFRWAWTPARSQSIPFLCLPPTPEELLHFLFSFVKLLIECGGGSLASQDERDLYEQIPNVYEIEPDQRRLGTLAQILSRKLAQPLLVQVGWRRPVWARYSTT